MRQDFVKQLRVAVLALTVAIILIARCDAAATPLSPAMAPARSLGAACECRCCWEIGVGRVECSNLYHEFVLRPAECTAGCTAEACSARYHCKISHATLRAVCRRGFPRAMLLLAFLGAALALLAFAIVRRSDAPADSVDMLGRDMLERRASYGSAGTPPIKRPDQPDMLPQPLQLDSKPHPQPDVEVESYNLLPPTSLSQAELQPLVPLVQAPNTAVVVDENAPLTQQR